MIQQDGCAMSDPAYGHNAGGDGCMFYEQVSADRSRVAVLLVNGYGESNAAQDQVGATPFDTMQRLYCAR